MPDRAVIVTGINGGIGASLGTALSEAGWFVIGVDQGAARDPHCQAYVSFDLAHCSDERRFAQDCLAPITEAAKDMQIKGLVNNAAVQRLGPTAKISLADWTQSIAVNLTAPFRLSQAFAPQLAAARGSIVNIGSVHARATKKEFVAYATTKTALHGLTRALAVDLGPAIRVVCLAPAAVATSMLQEGFAGREDAFTQLEDCHALERIAQPSEVAAAVCFLMTEGASFFSGATLFMDGGVLSRLNDPA